MRWESIKGTPEFITVLTAVLLLLTPLTAMPVTAGEPIANDEKITIKQVDKKGVTKNVSVWEGAPLTLRTDMSNADTKVRNAAWLLNGVPINKSHIGVYDNSDTISVHFTSGDAGGADYFYNENVTLIAGRATLSESDGQTLSSVDNFTDALNFESVNQNFTFSYVNSKQMNNKGYGEFEFTPSQAGEYVLFAVSGSQANDGLTVENGDLNFSERDDVTIVGVEHAMVHTQPSSATLKTQPAYRGDDLQFSLDPSMSEEGVQHAILVYDRRTGFESQTFKIDVSGNPSNLTELAEQTEFKHSIADVRGVSRIEDGTKLVDRTQGTTPTIGELMDFVANNTDSPIPSHELIDGSGNGTLNASITVVSGERKEITVETLGNWTASQFQWVHIAIEKDGKVRTNTGQFELNPEYFGVSNVNVAPTTVTAGESVIVTANVTNLGNNKATRDVWLEVKRGDGTWEEVARKQITLGADGATTVKFASTYHKPGTYKYRVNGEEAAQTVTVNAKSGGGGGGAPEPPDLRIETRQQADGSALVDIRNGRAGMSICVPIPSTQASRVSGVTFDCINVILQHDNSHFAFTVNTFATRPSTVPSVPADVAVKGYLQVDKQYISNSDISQATVQFQLAPNKLSTHSTPENIVLYRYHDGSWQALETTYVGTQDGKYVFKAVTPGFSVFAISEQEPDISVAGADLERSAITVGETVDVTVDVTNDGSGHGTYTMELTVDGTVVATKTVTLGPGETTTVTFSYTPSETGTYDIAVSGASAGTLEVTADDQPDDTTTTDQPPTFTTTPGPGDGPSEDRGPGVTLVAFLILLLLGGAGGALYYFREEVEAILGPYLQR